MTIYGILKNQQNLRFKLTRYEIPALNIYNIFFFVETNKTCKKSQLRMVHETSEINFLLCCFFFQIRRCRRRKLKQWRLYCLTCTISKLHLYTRTARSERKNCVRYAVPINSQQYSGHVDITLAGKGHRSARVHCN